MDYFTGVRALRLQLSRNQPKQITNCFNTETNVCVLCVGGRSSMDGGRGGRRRIKVELSMCGRNQKIHTHAMNMIWEHRKRIKPVQHITINKDACTQVTRAHSQESQ